MEHPKRPAQIKMEREAENKQKHHGTDKTTRAAYLLFSGERLQSCSLIPPATCYSNSGLSRPLSLFLLPPSSCLFVSNTFFKAHKRLAGRIQHGKDSRAVFHQMINMADTA